MAGSGYKLFASGEVLTAANLQGYAVDQSVMVFASSAARTTALAAPSEGMVSWLSDSNLLEVYDGANWKQFAKATGSVIDVQSVTKTDTQSTSIASGAAADITGLSISYSMKSTANKLLLIGELGIVAESTSYNGSGMRFMAGTTAIGVGDASGTRVQVSTGMQNSPSNASASVTKSLSMTYLYSPASTASITYKVQIQNVAGSTVTHYINRGVTNNDSTSWGLSISTFTIMEIAG